jgi:fructose-1,6-bisphosphatase
MLVDRLAYHMCINAAQNGGFETFFSERSYQEGNELYDFIKKSDDYRTARNIVAHWMKKVEQE